MRLLLAVSCFALVSACASSAPSSTAPATVPMPPAATMAVVPDAFALAMQTVADLAEAGNEQTAIDRLKQLLGDPKLTDAQMAEALYELGALRYGAGNDVFGAIDAWDELIDQYPDSPFAEKARSERDTARGEATSLNFAVETGDLSPTEKFETLFRLGRHQEAADLMLSRNLTPDNEYLLDMYQIGYLCEGMDLSGPEYSVTEPDGTVRTVQFCGSGK